MKHWFTTFSLTLMLAASFVTTNAFAVEQYHATITGYAPYAYSVTDDTAIAQQLSGIELSIASTISHNKGDAILTINVYGNADETGLAKDNQDYGTKRAVEVQNTLESKFQAFPGVTVHSYHFTNGTQQKTHRSTDVSWTVTPAPVSSLAHNDHKYDTAIIVFVALVGMAAIVAVILMAMPRKNSLAGVPRRRMETVKFKWNGKLCTTTAEWGADGKLHAKIPLPSDPNALLVRDDFRGMKYALQGLAKKPSYQPTLERLVAEKTVIVKEVS